MPNPMDKANFTPFQASPPQMSMPQQLTAETLVQAIQMAQQDPVGFEQHFKNTHPECYQQALQIRNNPNPKAAIMQMLQARGINPNMLNMLGLK